MSNRGLCCPPAGLTLTAADEQIVLREAADPATPPERLEALVGSFDELGYDEDYSGFAREVHRLVLANPNFSTDLLLGLLRYSSRNLTLEGLEGALANPSWPFVLLTDEPRAVDTLVTVAEYLRSGVMNRAQLDRAWYGLLPLHKQLTERIPLRDDDDWAWAQDTLLQETTRRLHKVEVSEALSMVLGVAHLHRDLAMRRWLFGWYSGVLAVLVDDDPALDGGYERAARRWLALRDELGLGEGKRA